MAGERFAATSNIVKVIIRQFSSLQVYLDPDLLFIVIYSYKVQTGSFQPLISLNCSHIP